MTGIGLTTSAAKAENGMVHWTLDHATMQALPFRQTPLRELILDAICEDRGHTSIDEVYARVRVRVPSASGATICQAPDSCCELGIVVSAGFGGEWKKQVIASEKPPRHLICRASGSARDTNHAGLLCLFERIPQERQFRSHLRHSQLCGVCRGSQRPAHPVS
jgi:Fur family ferric uptake transcriptional regulator